MLCDLVDLFCRLRRLPDARHTRLKRALGCRGEVECQTLQSVGKRKTGLKVALVVGINIEEVEINTLSRQLIAQFVVG